MGATLRTAKATARSVVRSALAWWYRRVPLERWPRWAGDFLEVRVPASVRPQQPSPAGTANVNIIIELLRRTQPVAGDVAECGVFRGATAIAIALHLRAAGDTSRVFALDSFAGFGPEVDADIALGGAADAEKRRGGFDGTSLDLVRHRLEDFGVSQTVALVPGFFDATLPTLPETRYRFVHLDCDIYESYRACLAYFYPRMNAGGIILFDEYLDPPWPGCAKAVDEFLATHPERPQRIESNGYQKHYIVKLAPRSV